MFRLTLLFIFLVSVTTLAAQSKWQSMTGADGINYFIYIPEKVSNQKSSLMIGLHGCSQHAEDLVSLANWESAADQYNMIVVLPNVPNGGVVLGCWDYYGHDHNESNRHNAALIRLTEGLIKNEKLNIDSKSVFITGLSSGSGEAAVLGCLRPDLFVGVGLNSGPALGTDKNSLFNPNTTADQVAQFCTELAGPRANYLQQQLLSVVVSDKDFIVSPEHSKISVQAMQKVYHAETSESFDLKTLQGPNTNGVGSVYKDANQKERISYIINFGLGHAFPSGKGPGRTEKYINPNSINYPLYLAQFFDR